MKHPNALVGTGTTIGGGEIVVGLADRLGWTISTGWGIAIAGAIGGVFLFIGRNGFRGVKRVILDGTGGTSPKP